jgi:hypothetical protein
MDQRGISGGMVVPAVSLFHDANHWRVLIKILSQPQSENLPVARKAMDTLPTTGIVER